MMSMPQSSTPIQSVGQVSTPIQTSASGGSSVPMSTPVRVLAIESYSTAVTDQSTDFEWQSNQQWFTMYILGQAFLAKGLAFWDLLGAQVEQTPPTTPEFTQQRFMALEQQLAAQATTTARLEQVLHLSSARNTPVQHVGMGLNNNGSQTTRNAIGSRSHSWAQAVGHPYGNQPLGNGNRQHLQQPRLFGQRGGRQRADLGNDFRQEPDAVANANQQHDFEVEVEQTLNAEAMFTRMVEDMGTAFDWYQSLAPEIRQKLGETAETYLIRFRRMYAKIPDKYEEPAIVKMAIVGIQDFKAKLAVAPHSIHSLNNLADIVRRCEKVIKDKREKNPGKAKQ
ncbi:OLC1v1008096C1 [Oldenlandia corymbosa var. corymbosa]|uniref:OLC1v1008096C1 n=1 Tax=Oldenlandia corymbosa var. corymbosa TaxID=529605 RepID=A0AAV1DMB0_OLDCO|nr:OLC1v1008096C1 [Oldenlandia corymbosa var. corymbosa]